MQRFHRKQVQSKISLPLARNHCLDNWIKTRSGNNLCVHNTVDYLRGLIGYRGNITGVLLYSLLFSVSVLSNFKSLNPSQFNACQHAPNLKGRSSIHPTLILSFLRWLKFETELIPRMCACVCFFFNILETHNTKGVLFTNSFHLNEVRANSKIRATFYCVISHRKVLLSSFIWVFTNFRTNL